ncbi:hypothetical protein LTR05_006667 [Lithohypha guttulata]|uniref:Uncharacterized protein n=1 Tax=Lithohypha guttulata TaxID=1690604 RepID=A0AAN7SVL1_9EURO|nr:hypothetical protein LTR05_006667 [Lithohypha guttulata]
MSSPRPTWFVTGTSNGFGLALAQHILRQDHNLVSLSRYSEPHESLSAIVSITKDEQPQLHHLQHDLAERDDTKIKSLIFDFLASHPNLSIDILVNNAAICAFAPVETIPTSTIEKVMTINFYSPLWMIQACLPNMRTSRNLIPKVIVNISSTQGLCPDPSEIAYDASKHALEALSGVLASEVAYFGVRVINVNLGSFRTAFATSGDRAGMSSGPRTQAGSGADNSQIWEAPYDDPDHPATSRVNMVMKFANVPDAARGDPGKGAKILFDAIMRTEGSAAEAALARLRDSNGSEGGLERLVIGSDAWPKIVEQVKRLNVQVQNCQDVVNLSNADDVQ